MQFNRIDQRVSGDFQVKVSSKEVSFYLWLNVSAIQWNEKLKKISDEQGREEEHRLEFDYISECEENEALKQEPTLNQLIMPSMLDGVI